MLISTDDYEALTGETAPEDFEALLARATAIANAALRRTLQKTEHTETLRVTREGWAWTKNYPIVDSSDPRRLFFPRDRGRYRQVTYTAGYTAETAPHDLKMGLAEAVRQLAATAAARSAENGVELPGHTSGYKVGDVSISFHAIKDGKVVAADGEEIPAHLKPLAPLGSLAAELLWRYRRKV